LSFESCNIQFFLIISVVACCKDKGATSGLCNFTCFVKISCNYDIFQFTYSLIHCKTKD